MKVLLKYQELTKGHIDASKTDERSSTCSEVDKRFFCPSNSCRQVASMLQKWTEMLPPHVNLPEGLVDALEVDRKSRQSARSAVIAPKVHQISSSKPEVFPPNRKCFRQTGSAFFELEVHLNCFHQTGGAPKVLSLNRKGTKGTSAHHKCFCQSKSVPKVLPPQGRCRRFMVGAAAVWELPPPHGRCSCRTGGAVTAREVPPPHGMYHRC